jgi:hypothetical protein
VCVLQDIFRSGFLVDMLLASALFLAWITVSRICLLLSNQSSWCFSSISVRSFVILTRCFENLGYVRFCYARAVRCMFVFASSLY